MTFLWVALGAAFGAPLRYVVDRLIQARHDTVFPWGTMTVNLAGCLLLGFLVAAAGRISPGVAATLGTGFCGALTTYSTFSYDVLRLLQDRVRFYAATYLIASLLGGFGAVGIGWTLGTWLAGQP
jgi:fluoride exporter